MSSVLTQSNRYSALARTISDVMSPPVLSVPGLILCTVASESAGAYRFALLYFAVAVVLPALYVVWLLKTGRIADFHLPERRDRVRPFLVSLCCGLTALGLLVVLDAPVEFLTVITALLLQALVLFLITLTWQVSIHTAMATGLITYAVIVTGPDAAALFLMVPVIGWARVYLGRHTITQTVTGACLGLSSFPLLFLLSGMIW